MTVKTGLTKAVLESTLDTKQAERELLQFTCKHFPRSRTAVLGGNSVYVDRQFLFKDMPNLAYYLHYRIIDVSSVKELCRRWYPQEAGQAPAKKESHRALDDIIESIEELRYLRRTFFKDQPQK
ncbi:Phosphatidylinositol 3,4,5-trisphosphate-dependent Rac exchanger 2 protein [Dispira simplex]|nr:Phosphatidylinositol 3,4,5-trisphosphate-dependent Rac exchanger 2 protein [Dispira simplex]